MNWEYGELYKKYDMTGEIHIGTGIVKVHDIFNPLPDFMKQADVVFCDPPCSKANINSFYSKAGIDDKQESYELFYHRFWEVIDEINPRVIFIEVFKSNKNSFLQACAARYSNIRVYDSMYYNKSSNRCWIIQASNEPLQPLKIDGVIDEENIIEIICRDVEYSCIADPCMGKGLIGFYSNKYGKPFVGTELNSKRLAVCCERVTKNERGNIK